MSVTIQDDMWAAAKGMRGKQGDALMLALLRYGFEGEEVEGDDPLYPFFTLCRERIDMSVRRSKTGAGRKPKEKECSKSKRDFDLNQNPDACEIKKAPYEVRGDEVSRGEESTTTEVRALDSNQTRKEAEDVNADVARIITHLNAATGKSYRTDAKESRKLIGARLREGFTVEDCLKAIDNCARMWLHDSEMSRFLQPRTIFGPQKFEGYVNAMSVDATPADDEWSAYATGGDTGGDTDAS